ncbi:MAG: hypothetical protein HC862_19735 [Scytonema sp. RU_4_4]|nr:hypothetical protein [Scytonema sp. RU_4_4]
MQICTNSDDDLSRQARRLYTLQQLHNTSTELDTRAAQWPDVSPDAWVRRLDMTAPICSQENVPPATAFADAVALLL